MKKLAKVYLTVTHIRLVEKKIAFVHPMEYNVHGFLCLVEVWRMKFMTASQAAEKRNISQRRVQVLCAQDRIEGAFKLGVNWAIPGKTKKPTKRGEY